MLGEPPALYSKDLTWQSAGSAATATATPLVLALPATQALADADSVSIGRLTGESFVSLPRHGGAVRLDRLRRLAQAAGFVVDIVQVAPDTQTALASVGAEVGCHLTLALVPRNPHDPDVVFVPVDEASLDIDLGIPSGDAATGLRGCGQCWTRLWDSTGRRWTEVQAPPPCVSHRNNRSRRSSSTVNAITRPLLIEIDSPSWRRCP